MPQPKHSLSLSLLLISALFVNHVSAGSPPQVKLETSLGDIVLELYPDKAPQTVANFLGYVDSGYYNGTIFHRVIPDFMIQGGGFNQSFFKKPTLPPIKNEANNGLSNARGTIAMARTDDPQSATSQFFINSIDNKRLDFRFAAGSGWGYCVFGKVVAGLDVVDAISNVETGEGPADSGMLDVPTKPVVLKKATQIKAQKSSKEKKHDPTADQSR